MFDAWKLAPKEEDEMEDFQGYDDEATEDDEAKFDDFDDEEDDELDDEEDEEDEIPAKHVAPSTHHPSARPPEPVHHTGTPAKDDEHTMMDETPEKKPAASAESSAPAATPAMAPAPVVKKPRRKRQ